MDVKPGWQTTEFWLAMSAKVIGLLVLFGFVPQGDEKVVSETIANAIAHIGALAVIAVSVWGYIKSRTTTKTAANVERTSANNLRLASLGGNAGRTVAMLIVGLFLCGSASAQTITAVNVTSLGDGTYLLTKKAGAVSVVPINLVSPASTPTDPTDPDDPTDPTDRLSVLRSSVTKAIAAVNQQEPAKTNTRTALARLYRAIAGLPVTTRDQLVTATDTIYGSLGLPAEWSPWKAAVNLALGEFSALDDARKAWLVVAESLEAK